MITEPVDNSAIPSMDSAVIKNKKYEPLLGTYSVEIRERFLIRTLSGDYSSIAAMKKEAEQLGIFDKEDSHSVCVISADEAKSQVVSDALLCLVREKICALAVNLNIHILCCMDAKCTLICVLSSLENDRISLFEREMAGMLDSFSAEYDVAFLYGMGPEVDRLELLSESYSYALLILERALSYKQRGITQKKELQLSSGGSIYRRLMQSFRDGDMDTISEEVRKHVESIRLDTPGRQVLVERFAVLYLQNITNECMRLGITLERFESYVPSVVCLMQLDSLGSVEAILQLTEQILKYISVHRTTEGNHLLNMAKDYIAENIGNERLDLAKVSDHVGLSRVYFCKLFHQLEGVSFSAYMKKIRIEKAKQLLLTTNMKVYEVSNAVGFSHAKYFGQVFKEAVGQTPAEFQKGMHSDL